MSDRDAVFVALEAVHGALKDLSAADQKRVLDSVSMLLQIAAPQTTIVQQEVSKSPPADETPASNNRDRPPSVVQLIQEKSPGTHAQRIALFAYYREKYERKPRFARGDLEPYFAKGHETPPGNYDRDFVEAVKKGWIHEAGDDSYITSKGIETVESGFPGERKSHTRTAPKRKPARKATKKPVKKQGKGAKPKARR